MPDQSQPDPNAPIPAPPPTGVSTASTDVERHGSVVADVVGIERGAVGGVRATDFSARLAAVGGVAANQATVQAASVGGLLARDATVRQSFVRAAVAQEAHFEQSLVRSVVAATVHAGPSTAILVAVARRIDGDAKILVDWRGALAFGVAFGSLVGAATLARRRS